MIAVASAEGLWLIEADGHCDCGGRNAGQVNGRVELERGGCSWRKLFAVGLAVAVGSVDCVIVDFSLLAVLLECSLQRCW